MKQSEINSQKNALQSLKLHVIDWSDGSEKDLMEPLRLKLQSLYSSMEVQILPMPTKMLLINSPCVILSMLDLVEKSSILKQWLQLLVNRSNLKIIVSLRNHLNGKVIYSDLADSTILLTPMVPILQDLVLEKVITGRVQIFKIKIHE